MARQRHRRGDFAPLSLLSDSTDGEEPTRHDTPDARGAVCGHHAANLRESELSQAFRVGLWGDFDIGEQLFRALFYAASATLRTTENAFTQYRDSLVSEAHFEAVAKRSVQMTAQLDALAATGETVSADFERLRDRVHKASDIMLRDVANWRLVVESRELEKPG